MKGFLIDYFNKHKSNFKQNPQLIYGDEFQDNLIVVFGKPKTAVFAHMDTVGFTCRYENQLVPIGGPDIEKEHILVGEDSFGPIECKLKVQEDGRLFHDFARAIDRGTSLVFKPQVSVSDTWIKGTHLDNRLGILNAIQVAHNVTDCVLVFSSFEEHGGGSVPMLSKYLYENYKVIHCLVSDITWVTDGVTHGNGTAISLRDKNIPRKKYLDKIIKLANESGISYQLEVEASGSSDGREIHHSPYPMDWCFIGAPEDNVHSPSEKVNKQDFDSMVALYIYLVNHLN